MTTAPSVGIVIVNYRAAEVLSSQLEAWNRCWEPASRVRRIAVVDNDSGDLELDGLDKTLPLTYLPMGRNSGFARAVNAGWGALSDPYVLLLSPDALVGLDAIDALATVLDEDNRVAAVAPLHIDEEGQPTNPYRRLPTWLDLLAYRTRLYKFAWAKRRACRYRYRELDGIDERWAPLDVEQPLASCLLLRRAAVGGRPMDERLPLFFNDVDLSKRLAHDGWRTRVIPGVVCRHQPSGSTRHLRSNADGELYIGAYRYVLKWEGRVRAEALRAGLIAQFASESRGAQCKASRRAIHMLRANQSIFEDGNSLDPVQARAD